MLALISDRAGTSQLTPAAAQTQQSPGIEQSDCLWRGGQAPRHQLPGIVVAVPISARRRVTDSVSPRALDGFRREPAEFGMAGRIQSIKFSQKQFGLPTIFSYAWQAARIPVAAKVLGCR
jgi:hypothetical protein